MILYHGSNVEVSKPKLFRSDRRADFGTGFYLTSNQAQAARWARLVARRRGSGEPLVSVFDFEESALSGLEVLRFEAADAEWLRFVGANRRGPGADDGLDLVIGPVANDNTMPTLRLYFNNVLNEEEAVRRLMPQNLTDQYAFKTPAALANLGFKEVQSA